MSSHWKRLLQNAFVIMDKATAMGIDMGNVTLGGGTAMMLHINHRDSHDIDLFLSGSEALATLNDIVRNVAEEKGLEWESGEGAFVSLTDKSMGDIDFIYGALESARAAAETPGIWQSAIERELEGRPIWVETVPEIIGKKIYYRHANLTARDAFDIAAACEAGYGEDIQKIVASLPREAATAAWIVENFPHDHVKNRMTRYDVRPKFRYLLENAADMVVDMIDRAATPGTSSGDADDHTRRQKDEDGSGGSMSGGPS